MMKMLDVGRTPGSCGGRRPRVARPVSAAPRVEMTAVAFLTTLGRYRERVGVEIAGASADGARWWSRRLVRLCEKAGWVRLDN